MIGQQHPPVIAAQADEKVNVSHTGPLAVPVRRVRPYIKA